MGLAEGCVPGSGVLCVEQQIFFVFIYLLYRKKSLFFVYKHIQRNVNFKKALGPTQSNDCFTEGSCD